MNRITKAERTRIDDRSKELVKSCYRTAINGDFYGFTSEILNEYIIKRLITEFDITRDRAKSSFGRAKMYWHHPKHRLDEILRAEIQAEIDADHIGGNHGI